ncbi:hypothetical protein FACS1894180_0490 [Bacteroidia bacterium]|nr:hypothetical protein FACS1894178_4120 [Bacteroidia bacterium]GHV42904.1 hypothetical protein FACS1894180_0490 [Bacteroidia bacterium]
MKSQLYTITALCILHFALCTTTNAQEYHYQQGFATAVPAGWNKTAPHTTNPANNHLGETFEGQYAIKFDTTCQDETMYLKTPVTSNAGILSFWASKNANITYQRLHITKIVNGEETEIAAYPSFNFPNKTNANGMSKYSVIVNEENSVQFRFHNTIDSITTNQNVWYSIDDIELTKYGEGGNEGIDSAGCIEKVTTNFADGTWGDVAASVPTSGTYPIDTINGFILNRARVCYYNNMSCPSGENHSNRISIDKAANNGYLEFPCFSTLGTLEIHAQVGTLGNYFNLEEEILGTWQPFGVYYPSKTTDTAFSVPVNHNYPTKMRIRNNTGGGILIYKIKTTTYQEEQELNVSTTNPGEAAIVFYNLTHKIEVNFNKEIAVGSGKIVLSSSFGIDSIPVENVAIDGKTATIPVSLQQDPSSDKIYTLKLPRGAFLVAGDATESNPFVLTFTVKHGVAIPVGYNKQIDVHYAPNDSAWQRMDIYYPTSPAQPVPVLINMHGGAWSHGEKESQGGFAIYFNMGFAVCNVEYRMTATATAPAAVEDVRMAMRYLVEHHLEYNIDPKKIIFQGGSAGGHLALVAGYLQNDEKYDGVFAASTRSDSEYKVIAVIDKYGPAMFDSLTTWWSSLNNWLGELKNDINFIRSISPAHIVELGVTPATYIVHGDADPTVPYSQSVMLADTLEKHGIHHQFTTIPGGGHGGFSTQYNNQVNAEINAFLTELLQQISSENKPNVNENLKKNEIIYRFGTIFVGEDVKQVEVFDVIGRKLVETGRKNIDVSNIGNKMVIVKCKLKDGNVMSEKIMIND